VTALDTLFWFLVVMLGVIIYAIEAGLAVRHRRAVLAAMFSTVAAILYIMFDAPDNSAFWRGGTAYVPPDGSRGKESDAKGEAKEGGDGAAVGMRGVSASAQAAAVDRKVPVGPFVDCEGCPSMIAVLAGRYTMGSPVLEKGRRDNEGPVDVILKEPFAVGRYEITRDQFQAFVDDARYSTGGGCTVNGRSSTAANWRNPGFEQSGTHPAVCVSWRDAKAYVAWLSLKTKKTYRLLSESEWEYVARGGVKTEFAYGPSLGSSHANYNRGRDGTIPVGYTAANQFGLHDVHGNAWELVEDCWNPDLSFNQLDGRATILRGDCSQHVMRGGGWDSSAAQSRLAARGVLDVGSSSNTVGFRVARVFD
jgi:formylglycine-generating enzyme required for sulfatase activity